MIKTNFVAASIAAVFLAGGASAALAQQSNDQEMVAPGIQQRVHGDAARKSPTPGRTGYRPLTVGARRTAVAPASQQMSGPGDLISGVGNGIATPFNSAASVGGPVGFGFGLAGGAIGGATSIAAAPFGAAFGGPVGISSMPAPPLPIKARFANTGAVATTYDEGYAQDVPVDRSGPIYDIEHGDDANRKVTPFSLLAFPITGAVSAITSPLRAGVPRS